MYKRLLASVPVLSLVLPAIASAHEVYVLDSTTIARDLAATSPNPFSAYFGNEGHFFFWGFVSLVTVSTILFASVFHLFESSTRPLFSWLKKFAHPIARLTLGLSLVSFGIMGKLFGTELSFVQLFGGLTPLMQILVLLCGSALILGFQSRTIALATVALYAYAGFVFGPYIFTYTDYLGVALLLIILGSGALSIDKQFRLRDWIDMPGLMSLRPYAFPIARMLFGFAIMFASIYAKYLHSQLALDVVLQYNLTHYFPFDPLFVVLGALIIEFLAGLMMFLGIEIRWTGLFLIFWLTLSLLYFKEAIWPHVILFGAGFALFCHGYDRFSLEGYFLKRRGAEPIL